MRVKRRRRRSNRCSTSLACNTTISALLRPIRSIIPDFARKVAESVADGEYDQGLLVCGSGTGMAIAANKVKGVRAAVAWNADIARLARQHNNANVLSIAARFTPDDEVKKIVRSWFDSDFEGGRHERRVEKMEDIEKADL